MNTSRPIRFSFTRCARRHFLESAAAALLALLSFGIAPAALAARDDDQGRDPQHWVASWATSPAAYFVYVAPVPQNQALAPSPTPFTIANVQPDLAFPFPNANTSGADDQTIRSIVKPDLWGNTIRLRLSRVLGSHPQTFYSTTSPLKENACIACHGT